MSPTTSPAATAPELEDLVCFDLYAASRAVTAAYRPILGEWGLTYPQYLVLVVLWERRECSIKDLADTLALDHGTLTPLLRRMQAAGLLERSRDPHDERRVRVALADGGERLRAHLGDIQCRIGEALGLSAEQLDELGALLRTITSHLHPRPPAGVPGS